MRKISIAVFLFVAAATAFAEQPKLRFDHLFILVQPGAPERAALAKAGFTIDPNVSRHDGQRTASISTEFDDGYIELMWVEPTVNVVATGQRAVEKFRNRAAWRTSGWSPFGINLSPIKRGDIPAFPFPTWSITMPWMDGGSIVVLTARDDTASPSVSLHPEATRQKGARHANSVKKITHVRIVAPRGYTPVPAMTYARDIGAIELGSGDAWLAEITFDGGRKKETRDLRPDLPLLVHY